MNKVLSVHQVCLISREFWLVVGSMMFIFLRPLKPAFCRSSMIPFGFLAILSPFLRCKQLKYERNGETKIKVSVIHYLLISYGLGSAYLINEQTLRS